MCQDRAYSVLIFGKWELTGYDVWTWVLGRYMVLKTQVQQLINRRLPYHKWFLMNLVILMNETLLIQILKKKVKVKLLKFVLITDFTALEEHLQDCS